MSELDAERSEVEKLRAAIRVVLLNSRGDGETYSVPYRAMQTAAKAIGWREAVDERHWKFLLSLDANKTRHSGRTLYEHLKGVHDLLRDWDNGTDVCLAGLFHSIYGTKVFKHQSLQDRGELVDMIGVRAELLVHTFATADRPLFESIEDKKLRLQLMEIEAANLIEQGSHSKALYKLSRIRGLSNGAKAALSSEVG